jgi:predicted dinucleotide-binding enzyme
MGRGRTRDRLRRLNDAKVQEVVRSVGGRARAATVRDVVAPSEVVVLATPWPAAKDALTAAASLHGRILVDATNPLTPDLSGPPSRWRVDEGGTAVLGFLAGIVARRTSGTRLWVVAAILLAARSR